MKTKIAIPQMGNDLFRKYMKSKYVQSLERAGGTPVWIELHDVQKAVREAMECDGLLLPGGADVNPTLYNEEPIEACGKPNALRDAAEPEIFKAFYQSNKAILGICRGVQIMNVALGGSVIQDIKPTQKEKHLDFFKRATHTHNVKIEKNTLLYDIFGEEEIPVNSMHHQTVKAIGEGAVLNATSTDGFIEGIECPQKKFVIGVQWHPEHMSKKSEMQRKLFSAFIEASKK